MLTELVEVPGGAFRMGSTSFYPEEAPVHTATVADFAIERHPVTNARFAEFVDATGYVTVAERPLDPKLYPGVPKDDLLPGSLVFRPTPGPVDLRDWRQWWDWVPGACWRHPFGPDREPCRPDHPVVQVAYPDAVAYATWAERRLPTEAEWEYAARGGPYGGVGFRYAWGDDVSPDGRLMANTWQGRFPYRNDGALGWKGTSPVGTFPPNRLGLVDMIGNVWEWTSTKFSTHHQPGDRSHLTCCPPRAGGDPSINHVLKGGSHLCAPEYCHRYRPAARSPQSQDSSTTHIGFRCVVS
ncbi:formylglycine-generating enzyme family protein [Mycolicibacterium goodii]|uniref:Formylglycine-generating enzyme family protein n=1 Tax=Mycolicibacterium goodii TaxID=134601 RepID=A0ABS6HG88_MYCGD|nr:formylglycine-generating enzyme family protein [Mycolicibacterium goodii]OKH65936.1 sulfatase-modifying factor 1 [Mycobacterium sp. SWH-M5]MBU8809403.1 formylglycine-generating enzyme family protein [Mycolicibacterium goodii]MBU8820908.1 formylglycine-generating enzyme family protein [Mycolicibacterium goodii]MBU8821699.1 formylglycine-generating enzyme family protein [Mycolicibacterium goodii]MBU8836691.1 formylglycine-generating enzyme family protein [Mycolicibacterium goodii]